MMPTQPARWLGIALVLGSFLVQTSGCGNSVGQDPQLAWRSSQLADDGGPVDGGDGADGGIDAGPPPDAGTDAGTPDAGEVGCSVIQTPPLRTIQNTAVGFGLHRIDWTAKTNPTHRINSPTPCDPEWQVSWPRVNPLPPGEALWTVFTSATPAIRPESLTFPSFARGIVHLVGEYTVFPKRPEDNGRTLVCIASFDLVGNQAVLSRLPFGAASSRLFVRLVVTPFPGIIPWDYNNTESCASAQIGPIQIPECENGHPIIPPPSLDVHAGPVPGTIRLGQTYQVDFFFLGEVARFGDAATTANARTLDFRIHCPDP